MATKLRPKQPKPAQLQLSRAAANAIHRVEGLHMTPAMQALFEEFDKAGLSHAERRERLMAVYGKKRA
jgi:hypothetical protein